MESSRITTSFLCSTRRLAFSSTISATCTWRSAGSSKVEEMTSPRTHPFLSVTSLGRSGLRPRLRVERRQVVEEDLLLRAVGRLEVDRVHLDESEVALVLLGRADLAADGVPGPEVALAALRGRDVD